MVPRTAYLILAVLGINSHLPSQVRIGRSGRSRTCSSGFGDRWFTVNRRSCTGLHYLVSLWAVCLRHHLQNLLSSRRSGTFFLFFEEW